MWPRGESAELGLPELAEFAASTMSLACGTIAGVHVTPLMERGK